MDLLLLRHADANTEAATDDARKLSDKGEGQAKKVARFLKDHECKPDLILTSPVRRALETAEIVSEHLSAELIAAPWAACGMDSETATEELRAYTKFDRVMLVGHEPDFSRLAAHLLGLREPMQIRIRKASLTFLELATLAPGAARLQWTLPCRFM
jgi:phosphohistidine phosphatase